MLALLFLVVIGLIVGGLASWTANDLSNATVFQNARSTEFALNSATQLAIQNIRYVPLISPNHSSYETLNASPPEYCWGSGPGSEYVPTQGPSVAVWCSTLWDPASSTTRIVTISACVISVPISASNWSSLSSSCAANPGLQTVVSFDDYDTNLSSTASCTSTCGTGMTIDSSSAGSTDPTVTGLSTQPPTSPASGPVTGGTPLTITGSGFVSGSTTVFFVHPNASYNIVTTIPPCTATVVTNCVTFNSATSVSVTTPAVTTVSQYYVVVSTPNGNSLDGPEFTYSPIAPTVTSLSPAVGSANGGTAVTINGTGFLSNAVALGSTTVTFTDTANSAITASSTSLSVNASGTVITATAPSITTGTSYYVTVTTNPGYSTAPSANLVFTFQPYYPVADSITPASGGSGTAVTVTGLGFLTGGTVVDLIPTSGTGTTLALQSVSVSSPTSLTAQVPPGGTATTYYVSVTTTWAGTQYQSCATNANGNVPSCSGEGAPTYTY